jgi:uncharacterized protein (DUF952 family)
MTVTPPAPPTAIAYKIETGEVWAQAVRDGVYLGSALDLADGFIHLSGADTVAETLRLYFAGRDDLVLVAVDLARLGSTVVWEASRGGVQFPHIYGPLPVDACSAAMPLPLVDGVNRLP